MAFQDRYNKPDSAIPPLSETPTVKGFVVFSLLVKNLHIMPMWDSCGISNQ